MAFISSIVRLKGMEILEAQAVHLPRIVELKLAMFEEMGLGHLLASNFKPLVLSDYQKLYESLEAKHFLATHGGTIVSMAGGFIKSDIPYRYFNNPRYGFVGDVYTLPSARRQDLATTLNSHVLDWLKKEGVGMVRLLASDAARTIYKGFGFQETDEMVLTFPDEGP
jgi:GNAT superfamily N-acetyltransferase